jgi:eukaryotic-like serine/threonine-protein kinase
VETWAYPTWAYIPGLLDGSRSRMLSCERFSSMSVQNERFGQYMLLEQIGVGGMAEVFLARHSGLAGFEKDIVIKRIRPHLSEVPSFVNMFLGEAKLAAQLAHPNIVQIYDLGKIKDSYFIAMEYVPGRDMSAVIPKAKLSGIPFPIEYALKIVSSVCEALYYAHGKTDNYGSPLHIVHRDVSPENIRVAWTGTVKILDFGIAKAATQLHETRAGEIKGKLSYMSPEQVMGKDIDQRSDIFSLGVVLYESLTGLKLFSGDTDLAIMHNIVEGKIYPPSYFRDDVPPEVEGIIMKALDKDRKRRYQSASDMQLDIDSFLASHEFTPSAIHLSNFLKQLFKEELEAEQQRRQNAPPPDPRRDPPPMPASDDVYDVPTEDVTLEITGRSLIVNFDPRELDLLQSIAKKRGQSPEKIIQEMVSNFLRFAD